MLRFLALAVLGFLLWLGVERAVGLVRTALRPPAGPGPGASRAAVTETLVRCARCGVHVPRSRLLAAPGGGEERFCSESCRSAAFHDGEPGR